MINDVIKDKIDERLSKKHSGLFNLRLGSKLHDELVRRAALNGVSLNAYVKIVLEAVVEND